MTRPVLVELRLDPLVLDEMPIGAGTIEVRDGASYATARAAIERLKTGELPCPLRIVVHSNLFVAGFLDLVLLGDLVHVVRIAPRNEIERVLRIQVPAGLSDRDLVTLGIRGPTDLGVDPETDSVELEDFHDALLAHAFGTPVFSTGSPVSQDKWIRELLGFFYAVETPARPGWRVPYVLDLSAARMRSLAQLHGVGHLSTFLLDLSRRAQGSSVRLYISQLAVRRWLADYPKYLRKNIVGNLADQVGQWEEVIGEASILGAITDWCEDLYCRPDEPLVQQLENVMALLFQDDGLFDAQDVCAYIRQTSGRFVAEWRAAQGRLETAVLAQGLTESAEAQRLFLHQVGQEVRRRFAPLLRRHATMPTFAPWLESLVELTATLAHLNASHPAHWSDWLASYELLCRARCLKAEVERGLPARLTESFKTTKAAVAVENDRLNYQYGDWLLGIYPKLLAADSGQPSTVMHAARKALDHVAHQGHVILLVLDCLDWQMWRGLCRLIAAQGFTVEGADAALAMLPTITECSRRAIFGGLPPRMLASFVDDIYGTEIGPEEEARTLARALGYLPRLRELKPLPANKRIQYLPRDLVYVNGDTRDFRQALALDARCYALVYTAIDIHIHTSKQEEDTVRETVAGWLTSLVTDVMKAIEQNPHLQKDADLKLMVTSDHGFLDISEENPAQIDASLMPHLDIERHGRLAIVRAPDSDYLVSATGAMELFHQANAAGWHLIRRSSAEEFGLAESSPSEGQVAGWLIPRQLSYVKRGRGNYVHGGLSLYETVVPLAVLGRGEPSMEEPAVTLSGQLASEEPGELSVSLFNRGDAMLEDLAVSIPELGVSALKFGDVPKDAIRRMNTQVIAPRSGDMAVTVVLVAHAAGQTLRISLKRTLTVQPGRRERMRQSTRRDLDD